jgi:hypothetical protein
MIAANHPHLGMNPHASGDTVSPIIGPGIRYLPPPTPARAPIISQVQPAPAQPAPPVNQISPQEIPHSIVHVSPVLETITETPSPNVPASAAAGTTPSPTADTTGTFDTFLNWLTEQTIYSGVPNGAFLAGGVIFASWMFSGKKGRR